MHSNGQSDAGTYGIFITLVDEYTGLETRYVIMVTIVADESASDSTTPVDEEEETTFDPTKDIKNKKPRQPKPEPIEESSVNVSIASVDRKGLMILLFEKPLMTYNKTAVNSEIMNIWLNDKKGISRGINDEIDINQRRLQRVPEGNMTKYAFTWEALN